MTEDLNKDKAEPDPVWVGVNYIICNEAPPMLFPFTKKRMCSAGCGRTLICRFDVPEEIPKVCPQCNEWISNCEGSA